ncbi:MAG: DUF1015 family protein [Bacteroidales bacterium]|jgi:uncharacterized protein (DUF1015 family)|nr:DUF1015 family protein [Bacteroidales bacterium]MDD4257767.1 DUF1015 family protein [Bacteroidales bacterium]
MVKIKPFAALRPPKELVTQIAARPYDVLNSAEAKAEAGEKSLLHITKPEIDFDPILDEHSQQAYDKAVENFRKWKQNGWLVSDPREMYYVYAQTMEGRTQYGLVVCANVEDYLSGKIKKHELTRKDKEEDRMMHVRIQSANIEPVFFAYPDVKEINDIVSRIASGPAEYDFTAADGFGHHFWPVTDPDVCRHITDIFASVPAFYVADGHHRTAAAALVGAERKAANPHHTGEEEYNWFMAVVFPESHLKIIDYNRVVKDLNGMSPEAFLGALSKDFMVECCCDGKPAGSDSCTPYVPSGLHNFSMYLNGCWYSLTARPGTYDNNDPIGVLDVTVLSNLVFDKLLDIKDLRTSKRIDFVGGIRGLNELRRRVDSGEMAAAFALYPVTMQQLIHIADTGNIMPPKTTWFEPKLRSGLAIHTF